MKEIKLTKGKVALVDNEDFEYLNQWKWQAFITQAGLYVSRIVYDNGKRIRIYMHRAIMKLSLGVQFIDHVDHNGLNNQKSNLRICTSSQNQGNRKIGTHSSKYKGVFLKNKRYIISQIKIKGKCIYLGTFKTEEAAARAYDAEAKKYHGEFANLNFK
jgi:hypothetical protein